MSRSHTRSLLLSWTRHSIDRDWAGAGLFIFKSSPDEWNIIFIRCDWNTLDTCELNYSPGHHVAVHRHPEAWVHQYRGPPPKRKSYRYLKDLLLNNFPWSHLVYSNFFSPYRHRGEAIVLLLLRLLLLRLDYKVKRMDWLMLQPPPLFEPGIIALLNCQNKPQLYCCC